MRLYLGLALGALSGLGCGDDGLLAGVTDECVLDTIVEARLQRGDVDCSPRYADGVPMEILFGEQPVDSSPEGQGSGSNTIFRFDCARFTKAPDLDCDGQDEGEFVCSQSERIRAEYR